MAPNSPGSLSESPSLEKVREQFLADCASRHDGLPPDLESYLSPFVEPELSSLRVQLEEIQRKYTRPSAEAAPGSAVARGTTSDRTAETKRLAPAKADDRGSDGDGTMSHISAPDDTAVRVPVPDDTMNYNGTPLATGEYVGANGDPVNATGEFVATPDGTMDHIDKPDGTGEYISSPNQSADFELNLNASAKPGARPLPQSVAGYEIIKILGRGAMGVVYKARQRGLKRLVALKMILSGEHASEQDLSRFQAEANAVAQLHHPGIVQIYEVGEDEGRPFFSLEFVDGPSLHKTLQAEPMSARRAAELLRQMAEAMAYAHKRGVIHRDLKPANVLMTSDGMPKIGDFGLAKSLQDDESGLTQSGTVLGTPSYMSPEQASGVLENVGPLTDVYSLGAILYDMLTGRPPFRGTTVMDTLQQLRTLEPVPPMQLQPGVPRDLETICLKCLQKDRFRRYADAEELAADVQRFFKGEPILARPISSIERAWKWSKRNKGKAAGIVGAIAGLVAFIAMWGVFTLRLDKEKNDAVVARDNETIAKNEEAEAKDKAIGALSNQRETATHAIRNIYSYLEIIYNAMQSKKLAINGTPELQKMRAEILNSIHRQVDTAKRRIEVVAVDSYTALFEAEMGARLLMRLGQSEEPRQILEIARKSIEKKVQDSPEDDRARANLGALELDLGDVAMDIEGDAQRAFPHFTRARVLHEEIMRNPKSGELKEIEIKRIMAHDDVHVGKVLLALGQAEKAKTYFEEALKYYKEWYDLAPADSRVEPSSYIMQSQMLLGMASSNLGNVKGVSEHFASSLEIGQNLLKQFTQYLPFKIDNAEVTGAYGDVLLRMGKLEDAQKQYQESMKLLQEFYKAKPDDLERQPLLALANERLGIVSGLLKQQEGAKKFNETAMQLRKELWEIEPKNLWRQIGFVVTMARAGDLANAMRLGTTIRARMEKSPEQMFQVARCFAICARKEGPDKKKNVEQAMSALAIATKDDYRDANMLLTDPDLSALRDEPAFKDLVAKIKTRK